MVVAARTVATPLTAGGPSCGFAADGNVVGLCSDRLDAPVPFQTAAKDWRWLRAENSALIAGTSPDEEERHAVSATATSASLSHTCP